MKTTSNTLILDRHCLETARKQFCLDIGLPWEEYLADPGKKVYIRKSTYKENTLDIATEGARKYIYANSFFKAIICLGQLFITCDEKMYDWAVEQYADCSPEWFCGYSRLRKLDEKLAEFGKKISDTHVYFLPEAETLASEETREAMQTDLVRYTQEELLSFKENNRFTAAICFSPTQPDMLAVVQMREGYSKDFDQSHMAGMAGVSADGKHLWQIGINVDPDCTGKGMANKLVRALKEEVLKQGKVPFYGTSESHSVSMTVGLKAGFVPAWTEIYVCER